MARGSFTSPSGAPPKEKQVGYGGKGKKCSERGGPFQDNPEYPISDDFAKEAIPGFTSRHANTNAKSGFNTVPAQPPAGRLAQHVTEVVREAGKEVVRDERQRDANSEGSLFVRNREYNKKGTELRKRPELF
jgi:hypothetical protein